MRAMKAKEAVLVPPGQRPPPVGRQQPVGLVLVPGRQRRVDAGEPEQVAGVPGLDGGSRGRDLESRAVTIPSSRAVVRGPCLPRSARPDGQPTSWADAAERLHNEAAYRPFCAVE